MPRLAPAPDDEDLDILLELLEDQLNIAEVCSSPFGLLISSLQANIASQLERQRSITAEAERQREEQEMAARIAERDRLRKERQKKLYALVVRVI